MSSLNKNIFEKSTETNVVNPYASSVNNLSGGLITLHSVPMVNVGKQLKELTSKQEFLITQIHNENLKLSEVQHSPEIQETFIKIKVYHSKLLNLKKDMKLIYERSLKLKKRAIRLQNIKEREQNKIQIEKIKKDNFYEPGPSTTSNN
ncbi:biogenesis of lysosome-related organelles complex 1 subunit 6 [Anoplophora glabripennis]|uniref:biogenesis of lysosome-related organelles complex 1 subunit 6 n=1 Tax=Anoplophora glabripennis TaxID=217634 RepID=UPI000873D8C4|nr:biogenesis of lysosome-related organelles complex 1 subunit 6 [Anoplophora glabripennis]